MRLILVTFLLSFPLTQAAAQKDSLDQDLERAGYVRKTAPTPQKEEVRPDYLKGIMEELNQQERREKPQVRQRQKDIPASNTGKRQQSPKQIEIKLPKAERQARAHLTGLPGNLNELKEQIEINKQSIRRLLNDSQDQTERFNRDISRMRSRVKTLTGSESQWVNQVQTLIQNQSQNHQRMLQNTGRELATQIKTISECEVSYKEVVRKIQQNIPVSSIATYHLCDKALYKVKNKMKQLNTDIQSSTQQFSSALSQARQKIESTVSASVQRAQRRQENTSGRARR